MALEDAWLVARASGSYPAEGRFQLIVESIDPVQSVKHFVVVVHFVFLLPGIYEVGSGNLHRSLRRFVTMWLSNPKSGWRVRLNLSRKSDV